MPGLYCELHAHSCYSLLDGAPFPEELAERAAELGLSAIALTDHDALYGVVPFFTRAQALGVKPILGAELTLEDASHLTVLAETQAGYRNLCQLITAARMNAPKGQAALAWPALAEHTPGLICLTGCRKGLISQRLIERDEAGARQALDSLLGIFGQGNVYVELQRNLRRDDGRLSRRLADLARATGLTSVATGNVHYLTRDEADLQSTLVSVRERVPLPQAKSILRPNHEYFLRSPAAMAALYPDLPEAVTNTLEVADRCHVAPPAGLQVLPTFPTPAGISALDYLRQLCQTQLPRRYPKSQARATEWLEKELGIIGQLRLANYFLVVWDIVQFCQKRGILCHGRGSAANSLVAHLLGISAIDPIAQGLVIERFISVEHGGTPDIDLDIDAGRRETVIQYVYNRWGRDHAAMACTYVTYRSASAIRDAGYALGFKPEVIEEIAQVVETQRHTQQPDEDGRVEVPDLPVTELAAQAQFLHSRLGTDEWQRLISLAERLRRRPRHLGLHNGGMIITGEPIDQLVPLEPATMEDRTVLQVDKEQLEQLGIVKIDLLGLRMLAAISDTVTAIRQGRGVAIDLHALDFRDPAVYRQIRSAHTIGIFQVESGAQVSVIPDLQPSCFQDLVIEVSLIRPGPLQGHMVRPFLRRRKRLEPVTYAHPSLKPALEETLGVIIFQEQVIKIARDFAGFTPGRGELLRRALGGKSAQDVLESFKIEFLKGATNRGAKLETARRVWQMIQGFAGYSFSKAHAAAFAVIVYWSAWLRVHFPAEYFCGLLRNAPLGTYPANVHESEARRSGIKFLPFDINRSQAKPVVENNTIRHGLGYVKGIGDEKAESIVQVRGNKPFRSLAEFVQRTGLERRPIEALILAGAFDSLGERRKMLWDLAEAFEIARRSQPTLPHLDSPDEQAALLPMPPERKLALTFAVAGVTAGPHLVSIRRDAFTKAGCVPYRELWKLKNGARVKVGGLVADGLRRPPTANGTSFIRLDTPDGMIDVIVPPPVYGECREALRSAFIVVEGILQRQPVVVTVLAEKISAVL